jgi:acyl-CoA hydrolase
MDDFKSETDWKHAGSRICMQKDLGINGNLFGGNFLSWMDEFAAIYARQQTNEKFVVTFKFGEIIFKHPVREGDLVDFFCRTTKIGHSSIAFDICAKVQDKTVFSTDCVFVAVDKDGQKVLVKW